MQRRYPGTRLGSAMKGLGGLFTLLGCHNKTFLYLIYDCGL